MSKMFRFAMIALMLSPPMLCPRAAFATVSTPREIVDRHVVEIMKGNLPGLMADYADDAVVVTPPGLMPSAHSASPGVFVGKDQIRKVFAVLTDKDHIGPVRSMVPRVETLPQGVAILHWVQFRGTPKEGSGEDVFRIRDGKIVFQFLTVEAAH